MANVRNANTFYIDTAGAGGQLAVKNIRVTHICLTGTTGATPYLLLRDITTTNNKVEVRTLTGTSEFLDYSDHPIVFPNGILPQTVTDCTAVLSIEETRA